MLDLDYHYQAAIDNLEAMLDPSLGVDAVLIGPHDLSCNLGNHQDDDDDGDGYDGHIHYDQQQSQALFIFDAFIVTIKTIAMVNFWARWNVQWFL